MGRRSVLVLALVGLSLVACKRSDPQRSFQALEASGQLRIAMTGEFPPLNYFNEKNELVGFDVDIAREISRRMELRPELITLRWDGIIAGLNAGRYELIVGSMAITPEREEAVDFSIPYYRSGAQVFTLPGSKVARTQGSLEGARVGVNLGTTYEAELKKHPEVTSIRTYGGVSELILDLESKRIDAFVTDRLVGLAAERSRGGFVPAGEPLYEERIAVALAEDQPELLGAVNEAIRMMKEDGTYTRLSQSWFGRDIR